MKCRRCNKRRKVKRQYDRIFCFEWGQITIKLGDLYTCKECTKELEEKISNALWEDKKKECVGVAYSFTPGSPEMEKDLIYN